MAATRDRMDEKVPGNPDYIKTTCGCGHRMPGIQTAVAPAPPARDSAYHTLRVGIDPQAWVLLLGLLSMAFMRLPSRSKAWLVLQRLAERIESVGLRGVLMMQFRCIRTQELDSPRPARQRRKPKSRPQGERALRAPKPSDGSPWRR